jgi:hypothetical protein
MLDASDIHSKLEVLLRRYRAMDQRWQDARAARKGDFEIIAPHLVSEDWPKPIIPNQIDVAARDLAEMSAPLPRFNCSSASMTSDAARKAADKRTKIAQYYVDRSKLDVQMLWGADHYLTYAVSVLYVEPDFEARCPRILIETRWGGYAEYDSPGPRLISRSDGPSPLASASLPAPFRSSPPRSKKQKGPCPPPPYLIRHPLPAAAKYRLVPRTSDHRWFCRVPMLYRTRLYPTPARLPCVCDLTRDFVLRPTPSEYRSTQTGTPTSPLNQHGHIHPEPDTVRRWLGATTSLRG